MVLPFIFHGLNMAHKLTCPHPTSHLSLVALTTLATYAVLAALVALATYAAMLWPM